MQTLKKENAYLKHKVDEDENKSWSSNLPFINVPERSEGRHTIAFMNQMIPLLFGKENFPTVPVLQFKWCPN